MGKTLPKLYFTVFMDTCPCKNSCLGAPALRAKQTETETETETFATAGARLSAEAGRSTRGSTCSAMTSLPVSRWRADARRSARAACDASATSPPGGARSRDAGARRDHVTDPAMTSPPGGARSSWFAPSMTGPRSTVARSCLAARSRSPVAPPS